MKPSRIKALHRISILLLSALLGLISALMVPAFAQPPKSTTEAIVQAANPQSLLQQGINLYKAEWFSEAAETWQQALTAFTSQGNRLSQALVLSNLSLAYQQLGRWQEAERAIADSLVMLRQQKDTANFQTYSEILAKALNTQGRLQWFRGQLEDALETWQKATVTYDQARDKTGIVIGLLNQAKALQALGFSVQTEEQLAKVYQLLQQQSDLELKASGLHNFGNALRQVGRFNESLKVLQESLNIDNSHSSTAKSSTLLDLGNTERALAEKAFTIGKTDVAQKRIEVAMTFYQQAAIAATAPLLKLQAQLNQLSLQVKTGQWSTAAELVAKIQSGLASLPPSRTAIYAQLNFAKSLTEFQKSSALYTQTANILAAAIHQSRRLNDPTAESYALGQLGELYELTERLFAAQVLTQQALLKAEEIQAADVRYRWEWQLGRLQKKQGNEQGAIAAYTAAVRSLQSVRNDLLLISSDIQFSFRDDVEPIYRELVELLLNTEKNAKPSQENLKQAIQQVDALHLTELENFLGCDLDQTVEISKIEVDPTAAKVYPMILQNRLAVVLELPGQNQPLVYHEIFQPRQAVEETLQQLRRNLSEPDRTPEAIAGLQEVYQWLIEPFRSVLESNSQIRTLVFVLDGELRNIPMAALYDGEQYLIKKYAVALAPRLELFNPNSRSKRLNVFLGGVGEPQTLGNRAFPKIDNLTPELNAIRQLVAAKQPLLNANFTETNLEHQLKTGNFSAIHLKTHGVFSSDPEETFVVAYRELITGKELGHLIQTGHFGKAERPIELLVLSACSTAQGDNRAVLGLAGIAVQAGARSVLSTLWEAQDLPNTQLMIRFYQELLNSNTTKAQALRLAQLHLLEQGYTTPHVWATYVLVGNWL